MPSCINISWNTIDFNRKKWKFGHFNSLSWPQKGDPISPKYTKICVFSFLTVLPSFFKAGWKMMDFSQKRWFWDILNMISQVGQFRSIHQNLCLFFFFVFFSLYRLSTSFITIRSTKLDFVGLGPLLWHYNVSRSI